MLRLLLFRRWQSHRWQQGRATIFIAASVFVGAGLFSATRPATRLENLTRDWRFLLRGPRPPENPIVIIAIDNATLDDPKFAEPLVFWGFHHAKLFKILHEFGAKAVGFDIVQTLPLADYADPNPDQAEAQALATMPEMVFSFSRSALPNGFVKSEPNQQLMMALTIGRGQSGFANTSPDADGVVRQSTLRDVDGSLSLALQVAATATGKKPRFAPNAVTLGKRTLTLDDEYHCIINFAGPDGTFSRISYRDLLRHPAAFAGQIKNSICLIGTTGYEFQDYHLAPFAQRGKNSRGHLMAGIEIQANALQTILNGDGIRRSGAATIWLCIALAVVFSTPFCWLPKIYFVIPGLLALALCWTAVCVLAFTRAAWQLPLIPVLAALAANGFLLTVARLRLENSQKKWTEELFGRYVSPAVLEHLQRTPGAVELGGRRQVVTVLFSDIRSFTEISEKLEPEQVTQFLNDYFEKMVEIVFDNGGTVDKFVGDGIMAVFNWPIEQPDHARCAARTALQMQDQVAAAQTQWQRTGFANLQIGIGIHSGPAVLGNIGSKRRMEQTAIGDTVNVASRLESLTKQIATPRGILISATTAQAIGDDFALLPAGETEIRGRQKNIALFALDAPTGEKSC